MSKNAARLLAAGLAAGGLTSLLMVARRLDAVGLFMLVVGVGCLITATWINTAVPLSQLSSGESTKIRKS